MLLTSADFRQWQQSNLECKDVRYVGQRVAGTASSCFGSGLGLGLGLLGNKQVQVHGSIAVPNCLQRLHTVCQILIGMVGFGFGYEF